MNHTIPPIDTSGSKIMVFSGANISRVAGNQAIIMLVFAHELQYRDLLHPLKLHAMDATSAPGSSAMAAKEKRAIAMYNHER